MKRLESTLIAISRATIAGAFWVASRIFHKVEIHGLEHDKGASQTYYGAHKRAAGFLAYADRYALVRRTGDYTWVPTVTETVIQVRPREVGFDQAPLMYAWNELQEMLSIQ